MLLFVIIEYGSKISRDDRLIFIHHQKESKSCVVKWMTSLVLITR